MGLTTLKALQTKGAYLSIVLMLAACSSGSDGGNGFPSNEPPVAAFLASPDSGLAPLLVAFDASASTDPDGQIVSYAWSFGDGSSQGTGVQISHTFAENGLFTVTLTVRDNDGATDAASRTISVGPREPVAAFTAEPASGFAPLLVSFDASASAAPDGAIVRYDWDFADGSTDSGVAPEHRFADAGSYVVRLTVTDDAGATDSTTSTIDARPITSVTRFEVTQLPSLPDRETIPAAINDRGEVAGTRQVNAAGDKNAFVFVEPSILDLGTLGGRNSSARDLNSNAQVVGWAELPDGRVRAFLFAGGSMQDLGTLGGSYSEAVSINEAGVIVGTSGNPAGADRAFRLADGAMEDIGTLGGDVSRASAINNLDQIAGDSWTALTEEHAFLYRDGAMEDIGTLGGGAAYATGLNDKGQVVGVSSTASGGLTGYVYSDGVMRPLGSLGGQRSDPTAINNHGQVVGFSDGRAFLWDEVHGMRDLNELIAAAPAWIILDALAINELGQIVGIGTDASNLQQPVLLTPVE